MKNSTSSPQNESYKQQNLFLSGIAEVKLSYSTKVKPNDRRKVTSSSDAYELFYESWDHSTIEHIETMKLLLLNRANNVLGITTLSTGGTAGCLIDVKVVFQYALKANASSIILAHNHPSGNRQQSQVDISITEKVKKAGEILDIKLLDHLILTAHNGYTSFGDEGLL